MYGIEVRMIPRPAARLRKDCGVDRAAARSVYKLDHGLRFVSVKIARRTASAATAVLVQSSVAIGR